MTPRVSISRSISYTTPYLRTYLCQWRVEISVRCYSIDNSFVCLCSGALSYNFLTCLYPVMIQLVLIKYPYSCLQRIWGSFDGAKG
ncbi:hypothetical protein BDW42DRAFT_164259 [Aspergillus taichungensis]|uniref:Uncharacterized protein n=1 Tax=Aspergillus taichungensis TaxID=482145 RepID=A0A2J5I2C2_9EURO|nr:hypothetical protein BDW42DRAFT_164259 [Aspergillus taichungensis]